MINTDDIIIAHSTNTATRHKATSGGIGSCILQELFNEGYINSAISYKFNKKLLQYQPQIINKAEDYTPVGSIYHEISLINFIKNNISNISSPFFCFALPCQVSPIKRMLEKHGIESFIAELTCSSQQSHEATQYLIKRAGIENAVIEDIRYRGNGWPGGVSILLKDNKRIFFDNNNSLWNEIFHSHLFIMQRCFFCSPQKATHSDIQFADPWGIDIPDGKQEGNTMCYVKSEKAAKILNTLVDKESIEYHKIKKQDFYKSQMGTIVRKNFNIRHTNLTRFTRNILQSKVYKKVLLQHPTFFKLHCIIYRVSFKILHKIAKTLNKKYLKTHE